MLLFKIKNLYHCLCLFSFTLVCRPATSERVLHSGLLGEISFLRIITFFPSITEKKKKCKKEVFLPVNQNLCVNQHLGVAHACRPNYLMHFLDILHMITIFFLKMLKCQKDDFDQWTAQKAPTYWSKYTALVLVLK